MVAKSSPRAPKGIDKSTLLDVAFALLAEHGEGGFSVRKLGTKAGVDPMTVLHHFGSRNDLMRQIADRALSSVSLPPPSGDWQSDLRLVAGAYRDLAYRYPRMFHLHFRFHATGPADHVTSEVVYRAMRQAGLADAQAAGIGLAFYAFVLGCGLAETEGLLQPLSKDEEAELRALDPQDCPATLALIPAFKSLDSNKAYMEAVDAFIAGIAVQGAQARSSTGTLPRTNGRSRPEAAV